MDRLPCSSTTSSSVIRDTQTTDLGQQITLQLPTSKGDVPAILLLPTKPAPCAAALLLHGFRSHKELMAKTVGTALLAEGIGSLSIDLPLHGERPERLDEESFKNPLSHVAPWRQGLAECSDALAWLGKRPEVDADRVGLLGYSMGSFLAVLAAASNGAVRAMVVAAGGDLPAGSPFMRIVRRFADPLKGIRRFGDRPLLMIHGRQDRTVRPEQAERLFAAAEEPKEMRWYDGGHWPPEQEIRKAAQWLSARLSPAR